jgi:hypothetical protein
VAVANQDVEAALRLCLQAEGYTLSATRKNGETGVDVLAEKIGEKLFIEVIGFKDSPPARAKDFFEVFFRAISRLKEGATQLVIALPERFSLGLHQRAAVYGPAWARLGMTFPELQVWLVNHREPSYRRTTWTEWLAPNKALQQTSGA